jgi:hypothetical protein
LRTRRFLDRQASPGEDPFERLSLDALHGDEVHRFAVSQGGAVDVVDRDDVGMVERGGRLGLALEAPPALGVSDGLAGEDLQGDRPLEVGVESAIDDAHSALAELAEDAIVRNGLFGHGREV